MGLFDKLKAKVGIGQPTINLHLFSKDIQDDQYINGTITIHAKDATAHIDEVKLEFVRKMKITQTVMNDGTETKQVEYKEGVMYRIIFKGNDYSKHIERVYNPDNGEMTERISENNPQPAGKIIIEPNQQFDIGFQFDISIYNIDRANMEHLALAVDKVESEFFIRINADMPGLDPKTEVKVNYTRTF